MRLDSIFAFVVVELSKILIFAKNSKAIDSKGHLAGKTVKYFLNYSVYIYIYIGILNNASLTSFQRSYEGR